MVDFSQICSSTSGAMESSAPCALHCSWMGPPNSLYSFTFSNTFTFMPLRCRERAVIRPAMPPPATSTSGRSSRGVIFCAASYAFWPSSVKVKARVCTARARRGAAARPRERSALVRTGARSAAAAGAHATEADISPSRLTLYERALAETSEPCAASGDDARRVRCVERTTGTRAARSRAMRVGRDRCTARARSERGVAATRKARDCEAVTRVVVPAGTIN